MASQSEGFANFEKFELHGKSVTKLKVDELKEELQARGLVKTGLKKELLERLCKALSEESNSTEETKEKPTIDNNETSVQEVSSTTDTNDNSNQDESQMTKDKKDSLENNEENKDKKKTNETNKPDVTDKPDDKNNDKATEEVEDGEITGQEDEKKEKPKPVPEKRRRISLTRQTSNPPTPGTRKRKWGSNKSKASVVISTDSLKGLIPGVQLASTPALEAVMELDDDKEDEEITEVKKQGEEKDAEKNSNHKLDERYSNKRRIVEIADSKTVRLGEAVKEDSATDKNDVIIIDPPVQLSEDRPADAGSHDDNHSSAATPPSSETATPVKREVSPPRNPPSCALHVSNLVRPFTHKQLMQHLSQFGSVAEDGFWMNKIKSYCYVTFASVDEATNARQSTHGQRWPATSPKLLKVDFADNAKMLGDTDGALGKKIESTEEIIEIVEDDKEKTREKSKEKSSRKHKDKKEEKKKDEPSAANLLDKLFRKTTAAPCIYWLPLTKEQIAVKEKEREERRKQRQLAIQKEEKQGEQKPHQDTRKPPELKPREKPREMQRDQERRPLRDNRASSPPPRQRPDRRPSPVKRRSRSRSPAFRRGVNRRR